MKQCHQVIVAYETSIKGVKLSLKDHMDEMNELRAMAKAEHGSWVSSWGNTSGVSGEDFDFRSKSSAERFIQAVQGKWSSATVTYKKIMY